MKTNKIILPALVSEIKLSYQPAVRPAQRRRACQSSDCYQLLLEHWDLGTIDLLEEFKVILLDRMSRVIGIVPLSTGGTGETIVDVKLIFSSGLVACATRLVLVHNHPSGNPAPSASDIRITKRLEEAGKLLDMDICDHLIITREKYYSFADEGMMS